MLKPQVRSTTDSFLFAAGFRWMALTESRKGNYSILHSRTWDNAVAKALNPDDRKAQVAFLKEWRKRAQAHI